MDRWIAMNNPSSVQLVPVTFHRFSYGNFQHSHILVNTASLKKETKETFKRENFDMDKNLVRIFSNSSSATLNSSHFFLRVIIPECCCGAITEHLRNLNKRIGGRKRREREQLRKHNFFYFNQLVDASQPTELSLTAFEEAHEIMST